MTPTTSVRISTTPLTRVTQQCPNLTFRTKSKDKTKRRLMMLLRITHGLEITKRMVLTMLIESLQAMKNSRREITRILMLLSRLDSAMIKLLEAPSQILITLTAELLSTESFQKR